MAVKNLVWDKEHKIYVPVSIYFFKDGWLRNVLKVILFYVVCIGMLTISMINQMIYWIIAIEVLIIMYIEIVISRYYKRKGLKE